MHAFLGFMSAVELLAIVFLWWHVRRLTIGAEATSERIDQMIESGNRSGEVITGRINSAQSALSSLRTLHDDLVRQAGLTNARLQAEIALGQQQSALIAEIESRIGDLSEGCERIDADLTTATADIREMRSILVSEAKEVSERITALAGEQEKIRRKAGRPGASTNAFESARTLAETSSRTRPDPERDALLSLAEGPKSV